MATLATGTCKKAFVSPVDSHLGKVLCKKFGHAEFQTCGTSREVTTKSTKWVKVVPKGEADALRKALLDADVIVYQLEDSVEEAITALKVLANTPYEVEKTFVLVSSMMTWFETETASRAEKEEVERDADDNEPDEEEEQEERPTYTEEEYAKRVPHVKYQLWKEVEKLCKKANTETLHTYCVFSGLMYGLGEDRLHPIFKQAWHLSPEGLPIFGDGKNHVPMIHVSDLATCAFKLTTQESPLDQRYFFAVDEGNLTWKQVMDAVNTTLGNGCAYRVPPSDYVLYESVEQFTIDVRAEPGKIMEIVDEDEWVAKAGFAECSAKVVAEFKKERQVEPLRLVVMGPPASGKSFYSRELASHYKVPACNIYDIIQDYEGQLVEFDDELNRIRLEKKEAKLREELQALRERKKEAKREAMEAAQENGEGEGKEEGASEKHEEDEEEGDSEPFDDELLQELKREKEANNDGEPAAEEEEEDDEKTAALKERLAGVRKVLSMVVPPTRPEGSEPFNPKDKSSKGGKKGAAPPPEANPDDASQPKRYNDKALAHMVQWKLQQPQCQNQGYILSGYPKTVNQARFLFEEGLPGDIMADGDDDDAPSGNPVAPPAEEGEKKLMDDAYWPDFLLLLKATDTFLTERVQKITSLHSHNNPTDFQRRLEFYKVHNPQRDRIEPTKDCSKGLASFMESSLTNRENREVAFRQFDVECTPLVPPPPPESKYESRPLDRVLENMIDFVGAPRNYGLSPAELAEEQSRLRMLDEENKTKQEAADAAQREEDEAEKRKLEEAKKNEAARIAEIKAHERAMLETRKEPLKRYLMENIIPVLTKGIVEVCEQRPDDPIDYLADWLFRHNPVEDEGGI